MQYGGGAYRPKPPSQGTAETLILVGFIFQIIFSVVSLVLGALLLSVGSFFLFAGIGGGILISLAALLTVLPILLLYVAYRYSYRRVRDGDLAGARGPTLALGVVGLFFGGIIVGILYIIAYVEIGNAENELRSMTMGPGAYGNPYGSPYGYRPPAYGYAPPGAGTGGVVYAPPPVAAPAGSNCPRCGRQATFIPQYGRSYCYSCAQYV